MGSIVRSSNHESLVAAIVSGERVVVVIFDPDSALKDTEPFLFTFAERQANDLLEDVAEDQIEVDLASGDDEGVV